MKSTRVRRLQQSALVRAAREYTPFYMAETLESRRLLAADIAVAGFADKGDLFTGDKITYTVGITNQGNLSAGNSHLRVPIPTNTTFVTFTQPDGRAPVNVTPPIVGTGGVLDIDMGVLAPDQFGVFTITLKVNPNAPDQSSFLTTFTGTTVSPENTTDNNSLSFGSKVTAKADFEVTVTAPATIIAGTDLHYVITIGNNGPSSEVGNFVFAVPTPSTTTFISITRLTPAGPDITILPPPIGQSGILTGTAVAFPASATVKYEMVVRVNPAVLDSEIPTDGGPQVEGISAVFSVASSATDLDLTNNTFTVLTPVTTQCDIAVSSNTNKTLNKFESQYGDLNGDGDPLEWIDYTLTVTNNGPSDAQNVQFTWTTSNLPDDPTAPMPNTTMSVIALVEQVSGLEFDLNIPTYGTNGPVMGTIDTLPSGFTAVFHIQAYMPRWSTYLSNITGTTDTAEAANRLANNTGGDQLVVPDAPLVVTDITPISAIVNRPLDTVLLMDYLDFKAGRTIVDQQGRNHNFAPAQFGDHTYVIDWGDGTTSIPTIEVAAAAVIGVPREFDVFGSHTYTRGGVFHVKIIVTGDGGPTGGGPARTFADIEAVVTGLRPLSPTSNFAAAAFTGVSSTITLGTFSDPTPLPIANYVGSIQWADGTTTAANITSNGNGTFTVRGTHTYASTGIYPAMTTIDATGAQQVIFLTNIEVTNRPVIATGVNINATPGISTGNVAVATFTDPLGPQPIGDNYTATINWGDGTAVEDGTITVDSNGKFSVSGSHTYATAATNTITTTISRTSAINTVVTSKAVVGVTTPTPTPTPTPTNVVTIAAKSVSGVAGTALSGVILATFTATNKTVEATGYTATINWGDGTTTTTGTLTKTAAGAFSVKGTHTYASSGTFKPIVTIKINSNNTSKSGTGSAAISPILKPQAASVSTKLNTALTNKVIGSLLDNKGNTSAAAYQITIDWGDGTAKTTGKAVYVSSAKRFDVQGTHTYKKKSPAAGFKVTITVKAISGPSKNATATIASTIFVT